MKPKVLLKLVERGMTSC